MNKLLWLSTVLMLAILLAACGGTETTTDGAEVGTPSAAQEGSSVTLSEEYTDAASLRNQLALGTLRLEGTPQAITAEQAGTLLPLWQTLKALGASTTAAAAEVDAVHNQIVVSLTEDQVAAIAALQLTNADVQAYYAEIGLAVQTPEPGVTPQSGAFKDLPPEQREAARATAEALGTPVGAGRSSGTSKSDVLLDNVIEMLTGRAGGS
jgi:hypothetical protein